MTHDQERVWLISRLKQESPIYKKIPVPPDEQAQKDMLRSLLNMRMPSPVSREFLEVQDAYFRRETIIRGIVDEKTLTPCSSDPRLFIWQGDITRLRVDAIVNAANSGMTGCYTPLHNCIDNCIHSAAGIRLRLDCAAQMERQGHEEPVGRAKITPGYALPARYVLHTVGPLVDGGVLKEEHRRMLRSSYLSCLRLAAENELHSVAFCCLSTGVFMFPAEEAARIAVTTVKEYLDAHAAIDDNAGSEDRQGSPGSGIERVIFNVFSDRDREIYEGLLQL